MEANERGKNSFNFRDLTVYKKGFSLAMDIFRLTKGFPPEERYELSSQIRRSSRAVCSAVTEGYRKRQYEQYFVSKMSDGDMENSETQNWLDFALACEYIDKPTYASLLRRSEEVGRMLNHMIENPEKYRRKSG